MTRRLLLSYVSIAVIVLAVLEIPLGLVFSRSERRNLVAELKQDALTLGTIAEETLEGRANADIQELAKRYDTETGGRVIITDRRGILLADSTAETIEARDFSTRPEIAAALRGMVTDGTRHSNTLDTDLIYVVAPISSGGRILGTVRITFTPTELDALIRRGWLILGLVGLGVLVTTTAISVVLARSVSRPLRQLERAATELAGGDLTARAQVNTGPAEVRALADAFNTMAARLEQLIDAQDDFVADASHQLRTPLQALRLRIENAEAQASDDTKVDLGAALAETERLGQLIDGLLALARAEAAHSEMRPVDVETVIAERIDAWGSAAQQKDVRLVATVAPKSDALATPGHLEQILDNLISNAIKVSPPGSTVAMRTLRHNSAVEIHVADQGPGMTEEQLAHATERFWSVSTASGGTGIGLAIADRLATADGGTLELRRSASGGIDAVVSLRVR